jgi:hypothetical protein
VLVARARSAAREEVRHARLCFTLASAYAGSELDPGPLPPNSFARPCPSLEALAIESLHDGCVAEGVAAAQARAAGRRARDPAVRAALRIIARDEAGHAALAWSIVTHCLRRDDGVRRALARELEGLERQRVEYRRSRVTSNDDAGAESRHGELSVARQHVIAARVIDRVVARLAKALARADGCLARADLPRAPNPRLSVAWIPWHATGPVSARGERCRAR